MKKLLLYTILTLLFNVGLFFLISFIADNMDTRNIGDSIVTVLALIIISLGIEVIAAIMLIAGRKTTEIGKAILLSVGIIFLVGLSLCSGLFN